MTRFDVSQNEMRLVFAIRTCRYGTILCMTRLSHVFVPKKTPDFQTSTLRRCSNGHGQVPALTQN